MQLFNMADSVSSYNRHSNISTNDEVTLHRYVCYKCSDYEEQLKEVITELSCAETIIKILQKELRSITTIHNKCARNHIVTEGPGNKPITKEWALITPKNNTEKLQTSDKENKNKFTITSQPISTANRFTLLSMMKEPAVLVGEGETTAVPETEATASDRRSVPL